MAALKGEVVVEAKGSREGRGIWLKERNDSRIVGGDLTKERTGACRTKNMKSLPGKRVLLRRKA